MTTEHPIVSRVRTNVYQINKYSAARKHDIDFCILVAARSACGMKKTMQIPYLSFYALVLICYMYQLLYGLTQYITGTNSVIRFFRVANVQRSFR